MAYIYIDKRLVKERKGSPKYRLFGTLPLMCERCGLDYPNLQLYFRGDKKIFDCKEYKIIKTPAMERRRYPVNYDK